MKFLSLQPFVPSGPDFERSKQLFLAIGFDISWDAGDYIGFVKDDCRFILQKFNDKNFAENFMISIAIPDADEFFREMKEKKIDEKFGVRISAPAAMPYGKEVNLIDIAGVCWHFVQA